MKTSHIVVLILSLMLFSSAYVSVSDVQSAGPNIRNFLPDGKWIITVEELPVGSYFELEGASGSFTIERFVNNESTGQIIPFNSGSHISITQDGNDKYIITNETKDSQGQSISASLCYTLHTPNGSPILYASICIGITLLVGFLLFYNGRVAKLD